MVILNKSLANNETNVDNSRVNDVNQARITNNDLNANQLINPYNPGNNQVNINFFVSNCFVCPILSSTINEILFLIIIIIMLIRIWFHYQ